MKSIFAVVGVLAALTGCATQQPYYTSTRVVHDPYQWRTVSVTPSDRAPGQSSGPVYTTEELPPQSSSRVVYTRAAGHHHHVHHPAIDGDLPAGPRVLPAGAVVLLSARVDRPELRLWPLLGRRRRSRLLRWPSRRLASLSVGTRKKSRSARQAPRDFLLQELTVRF